MVTVAEVMGQCLCSRMRKLGRSVTRLYNHELRPAGLNYSQFNVLAVLDHLGPCSIAHMSEKMGVDRTTLLRNLGLLKRRGLIERLKIDGRVGCYVPTVQGHVALQRAIPFWEAAEIRMAQFIGTSELAGLRQVFDTLAAAIR